MTRAFSVRDFRESEARLNETGALLGEMAALLSDVADCLSHAPTHLSVCVSEAEWPSLDRLQAIVATWADRREELALVWRGLSAEDREAIGSFPDFEADQSAPV